MVVFVNAVFLFLRLLWPLRRYKQISQLDVLDSHFVHPDGVAAALAGWILRKPFFIVTTARALRTGTSAILDAEVLDVLGPPAGISRYCGL